MNYISTRGQAPVLPFDEVVLTGLASDGGLYVPEHLPSYSQEEIASWVELPYEQLAFKLMQPFVAGTVPDDALKTIIANSYAPFRHQAITPLVQIGHNEWILELFHGPTLAFKDVALQFLGHLLDYLLAEKGRKGVVLGATSGDTGSAAIEGCRRCDNLDIFILHPHGKVSEVQRRQMTTVLADNVHNIALEGNFDHCQNIVKDSFGDQSFLPEGKSLVAVNSINWARILAQIVYYFYAALHLGGPHRPISFSVPTGNFGDIFAGYLAQRMGLPVQQLVIATNANDILHRAISHNDYSTGELLHTLSPSMDIMISSNFERFLFELYGRDAAEIKRLMETFKAGGSVTLDPVKLEQARRLFSSHAVDDATTVAMIREVFERTEYLLDPHTAIGLKAARACNRHPNIPMVTLATAHPAKFPDAVKQAGQTEDPALPYHMRDLFQREERFSVLANDPQAVRQFIREHT